MLQRRNVDTFHHAPFHFTQHSCDIGTLSITQPQGAQHRARTHISVHKNSQLLVPQSLQLLSMIQIFRGELVFDNVVQKQVSHVAVNNRESICSTKYEKNSDSLKLAIETLKTIQIQSITHISLKL